MQFPFTQIAYYSTDIHIFQSKCLSHMQLHFAGLSSALPKRESIITVV